MLVSCATRTTSKTFSKSSYFGASVMIQVLLKWVLGSLIAVVHSAKPMKSSDLNTFCYVRYLGFKPVNLLDLPVVAGEQCPRSKVRVPCWFLERKRDDCRKSLLFLPLSPSLFRIIHLWLCWGRNWRKIISFSSLLWQSGSTSFTRYSCWTVYVPLWTSQSAGAFDQAAADADLVLFPTFFHRKEFYGTHPRHHGGNPGPGLQERHPAHCRSVQCESRRGAMVIVARFLFGSAEARRGDRWGNWGGRAQQGGWGCKFLRVFPPLSAALWAFDLGKLEMPSRRVQSAFEVVSLLSATRFFAQSYESMNWNVWSNENKMLYILLVGWLFFQSQPD